MNKKSTALKNTAVAKLGAVLVAAALTLTACSGGAPSETTLELNQPGSETSMTYYAEGDTVTKQTTKNVLSYEESGLVDKETAKEAVEPLAEQYRGVTGIEHNIEYGDTELTETLTVDYTKADISEVSKLAGTSFTGDADNAKKISLKQSVEALKAAGFTEVK